MINDLWQASGKQRMPRGDSRPTDIVAEGQQVRWSESLTSQAVTKSRPTRLARGDSRPTDFVADHATSFR